MVLKLEGELPILCFQVPCMIVVEDISIRLHNEICNFQGR